MKQHAVDVVPQQRYPYRLVISSERVPCLRLQFHLKLYAHSDEEDVQLVLVVLVEQCLRLDCFGLPSRAAVEEDTPVVAWEEELQEKQRCLCSREEAVEEHHIHNNDNSNHNTAAYNGSGVPDCMGVQDVGGEEEVVVHGEESRDHLRDDGLSAQEDTMVQVSTKLVVDQPSSLDVSSLHVVG